jgi:hypothetical protein
MVLVAIMIHASSCIFAFSASTCRRREAISTFISEIDCCTAIIDSSCLSSRA